MTARASRAGTAALATMTYDDRTTIYMNGDGIQLIPLPGNMANLDVTFMSPVRWRE